MIFDGTKSIQFWIELTSESSNVKLFCILFNVIHITFEISFSNVMYSKKDKHSIGVWLVDWPGWTTANSSSVQMSKLILDLKKTVATNKSSLMGEGFILLTRGYGFMGGWTTPFWHVINWYFYWWYKVETLQVVRLAFLV